MRIAATICDKVGNQLIHDLNSMINNKEYSDLIIVINGHKFMAHKAVLATRSQVFAAMSASDMKANIVTTSG
jgi:hypothetical protein